MMSKQYRTVGVFQHVSGGTSVLIGKVIIDVYQPDAFDWSLLQKLNMFVLVV